MGRGKNYMNRFKVESYGDVLICCEGHRHHKYLVVYQTNTREAVKNRSGLPKCLREDMRFKVEYKNGKTPK